MSIIWDIVSIAIIAISIYVGVKRGFVRSVVTVLSYFVSFIIARVGSPKLASLVYNNYLGERITNTIAESIIAAIEAGAVNVEEVLKNLPGTLSRVIQYVYPDFAAEASENLLGQIDSSSIGNIAEKISQSVEGVITEFVSWTFFIVIFLIALFILKKIAGIFSFVNNIPIVGSLNMVLGGVTGIGIGVFIIILVGIVAFVVGVIVGGDIEILKPETIDSSLIMGTLKQVLIK